MIEKIIGCFILYIVTLLTGRAFLDSWWETIKVVHAALGLAALLTIGITLIVS